MYLYVALKLAAYNGVVNIYTKNLLKKYVLWSKNETLKKHLILLKEYNYIDYDFEEFPMSGTIQITIPQTEKPFTQVDRPTVEKIISVAREAHVWKGNKDNKKLYIEDIKEMAIKLFYYYFSYYNADEGKAYPKYEEIHMETKISNGYIKAINNMFSYHKLVHITIGDFYNYKDDDSNMTKAYRPRNEYVPLCNVKKKRKEINNI
jgi:hypothetical protein